MPLNNALIKSRAREICRDSKPSPFVASLIYVALSLLLTYLSSKLLSGNVTESGFRSYMNYIMNGNVEKAIEYSQRLMPSKGSTTIDLVIRFLMQIVSAGFTIFIMNTVRRTGQACYENLLDGFGLAGKILLMYLLKAVIIGALCCLLIVPGIIAAFKYSQSLFILLDNPEKSVVQCLRESKYLMDGHKAELFWLDLSFIGWILLEAIFTPAEVYVLPYMETTHVLYYDFLRGEQRRYGGYGF